MPTKARYDRLKAERPEVWRRAMKADQQREAAKSLATFPLRHPARAGTRHCQKCSATFVPRRAGGSLQRFCSKHCKELSDNHVRRIRHPDRVKVGLKKLAAKRRLAWRTYMATQRCARCGENHPATLDHHHLDRSTKAFSIATWAAYRFEKVLAEAAKCVVLCSNCHRKLEWDKKHEN